MEINPAAITHQEMYKLLIGTVQPRPIAWVSTMDANGKLNLAPFSFFNVVCAKPPTVIFCPGIRAKTGLPKDSWLNVQATGEFVVNIVSEAVAEKMNLTSAEVEAHIDEFELAGLTPVPSTLVKVPRVAESPISMECKLQEIVVISEEVGGGAIVIGTVVYMHIADAVYIPDFKIDTLKVQPIGRLAGANYSRTNDLFEMPRPQ